MKTNHVLKHDVDFKVADLGEEDINNFCVTHFGNSSWEEHTFYIFDKFRDTSKTFIDMGGWLGITPLYASFKFRDVIAFECDEVALKRFKMNLKCNPNITNIEICEKAIWNKNGTLTFGHKTDGELGDSESSVHFGKNGETYVESITFLNSMKYYQKNLRNIGFIKMDIEGAEAEVIKDMNGYISMFKPTLYLSIHHHLLTESEVDNMLLFLFSVYSSRQVFNEKGKSMEITKEAIMDNKLGDCVFTQLR